MSFQGRLRDAIAMGSKITWPKGRKMLVMENIKEEDVKRDASKITGAIHSVGKCNNERKGVSNVESKMRDRSLTSFSADYYVPKRHPPKNN